MTATGIWSQYSDHVNLLVENINSVKVQNHILSYACKYIVLYIYVERWHPRQIHNKCKSILTEYYVQDLFNNSKY
jgi:hypothetical protein